METIKSARKQAGLTQAQLAQRLGVSRSTVAMWERGASRPDLDLLAKLADLLGSSADALLGRSTTPPKKDPPPRRKGIRIPVYGAVAAGLPIEAITEYDADDPDDWEEIDEHTAASGSYIALRLQGDSMEPRMSAGDVVIVRLQEDAESGDIIIAMINGDEATCKKLQKTDSGLMLVSFNPAYPPLYYSRRQCMELPVRILGRVVELRAKF